MISRFEEIRESRLRHKPDVQIIMDLARHFRSVGPEQYDAFYKEMQTSVYKALERAYTTGQMSNDTWK
jgi:hypothetical protein